LTTNQGVRGSNPRQSATPYPAIFDGHNDLLLRLWRAEPHLRDRMWLEGDGQGHLDLPRMRKGGFGGGLFAIYVPSPQAGAAMDEAMDRPPYDLALPEAIPAAEALPAALGMAGLLLRMERVSGCALAVCRSAAEIRGAMVRGRIAAVMHMEGAEAIGADLDALHLLQAAGLRSLGPVWSRPTIFGHGVPFRFPGDPDTGPGLTAEGRELVRACDDLRILVDLSHLNANGFDDVAAVSTAPLVATHSNAHAVTPSTRNLTDRQLAMIGERGGMVGLNFATCFLRPDGRRSPDMGWEPVLRHLDHLIGRLGEDHVGFGSDFDGATLPRGIGDAAGLPALMDALAGHGYDEGLLGKLAQGNWMRTLERIWGA
jgi:membrane dipeptidase